MVGEIVKPEDFGLIQRIKNRKKHIDLVGKDTYLEDLLSKIALGLNRNPRKYWLAWKDDPKDAAKYLTLEQKTLILEQADLTNEEEAICFLRHLETYERSYYFERNLSSDYYLYYAQQIINNEKEFPGLARKIYGFLNTKKNVRLFFEKCPNIFDEMSKIFFNTDWTKTEAFPPTTQLIQLFFTDAFFNVLENVFEDEFFISRSYAGKFTIDILIGLFASEEMDLDPEYFLRVLKFFKTHNPALLKQVFATIAINEANGIPEQRLGAVKLRQFLFAAHERIETASIEKRKSICEANEKYAEFFVKNTFLTKVLLAAADDEHNQDTKDILLSTNAPKLLDLSQQYKLRMATELSRKGVLTCPALGRAAIYLSKLHSSHVFNKWWQTLKNSAGCFIEYIKNRIENSLDKDSTLVNLALADRKIKGKINADNKNIFKLIEEDKLTPSALRGLAADSDFWCEFKKYIDHEVFLTNKESLLRKSPYFLAKWLNYQMLDLILERCHKKLFGDKELLEYYYNNENLKKHIQEDEILISEILEKSTPEELINCAKKFPTVIPRAIIQKGYLQKLLTACTPADQNEIYKNLIVTISQTSLSIDDKRYAIQYMRPRLIEESIANITNKYKEDTLFWKAEKEKYQQHWVLDKNRNPFDLRFKEKGFFIPFVKNLIRLVEGNRLDNVLLKTALYFANDKIYLSFLNPFLEYKFGIMSSNIRESIKAYLCKELHKPEKTLDFLRDIKQLTENPKLSKALGLTDKEITELKAILENNKLPDQLKAQKVIFVDFSVTNKIEDDFVEILLTETEEPAKEKASNDSTITDGKKEMFPPVFSKQSSSSKGGAPIEKPNATTVQQIGNNMTNNYK